MFLLESKAMSLFDLGCLKKSAMRVQLPLMTRGHCTAKVSRWPIHWHSLMSRSGLLFMEVKRCFEDFWTDTVPTMIVAVTCLRHSLARSQSVDCCCQQSLVFWVIRRWCCNKLFMPLGFRCLPCCKASNSQAAPVRTWLPFGFRSGTVDMAFWDPLAQAFVYTWIRHSGPAGQRAAWVTHGLPRFRLETNIMSLWIMVCLWMMTDVSKFTSFTSVREKWCFGTLGFNELRPLVRTLFCNVFCHASLRPGGATLQKTSLATSW